MAFAERASDSQSACSTALMISSSDKKNLITPPTITRALSLKVKSIHVNVDRCMDYRLQLLARTSPSHNGAPPCLTDVACNVSRTISACLMI
jgi:hypothetical protein